jgi:hypothetical protein
MTLDGIVSQLINRSPPIADMRGQPGFQDWAGRLVALGGTAGLEPLRPLLAELAADELKTLEPLQRFLSDSAAAVPLLCYRAASDLAERTIATAPCTAFLLSLIALTGWRAALGQRVYEQQNGMPHPGWLRLPHICAHAATEAGAIDGCRELVDDAYDTLMAAKYVLWDPQIQTALQEYRKLRGRIQRRYDGAVANLVDDLRESCRPGAHDFRAEIGAILWSLGQIPESRFFRSDADPGFLPSRRLCRTIVERSLDCMAVDPLVQYVWLELKDRLPFNIRDHRALFGRVNQNYHQLLLDDYGPVTPSRIYAQTLIAWFRGDIGGAQAAEYSAAHDLVRTLFPSSVDWVTFLRFDGLAFLLTKQFDGFPPGMTEERQRDYWYHLCDLAADVRRNANLHPEWPRIHGRSGLGPFWAIEAEFQATDGEATDEDGRLDRLLAGLEGIRASGLSYWLKRARPLPPPVIPDALGPMLDREDELLGYLRGSYFLTLHPMLPRHYARYGMQLEDMLAATRDGKVDAKLDPEVGRRQFKELTAELQALYEAMRPLAPTYAAKRLDATADRARLLAAIRHPVPSVDGASAARP